MQKHALLFFSFNFSSRVLEHQIFLNLNLTGYKLQLNSEQDGY